MLRYVASRLVALIGTLLVTSFVVFGGLYISPGGPIAYLTGGRSVTPEQLAAIREQYRLDEPFIARYGAWLGDLLQGELGQSLVFRQDVWTLLSPRLGTTIGLVIYASALIVVGGMVFGTIAALRGGVADRLIVTTMTAGLATPAFVSAIVLITVFSVQLGWFPVFGRGEGFVDSVWHLTLPAVALAFSGTALVARVTRAAVRGERGREHVQTARSRGLPERQILRRHVLRNAFIPITTVGGLTFGGLIAGSVIVETAFGLDGISAFLVASVNAKDYSVVQAICMILVTAFVLINTLVDALYVAIDPRVRTAVER